MSQFSFNDWNQSQTAQKKSSEGSYKKVGFFKLPEGNALVRINCKSVEDLKMASIHNPIYPKQWSNTVKMYGGVSCLHNPTDKVNNCPFCRVAKATPAHEIVGPAKNKVYIEMMVSKQDPKTKSWLPAEPMIWERPSGMAVEIAAKIKDYGDLREVVFKVDKTGEGKDTKYNFNYLPIFQNEDIVPKDFSAFENFNINKHSFWEKTAEEMEAYLATGVFPATEKKDSTPTSATVNIKDNTVVTTAPSQAAPEAKAVFADKISAVDDDDLFKNVSIDF